MKTMKKAFALLLAVVMVMGLSVTAFAAEITVNGKADETYTAYKIFDVTQSENPTSYKQDAEGAYYHNTTNNTYETTKDDTSVYETDNGTDVMYSPVYSYSYSISSSDTTWLPVVLNYMGYTQVEGKWYANTDLDGDGNLSDTATAVTSPFTSKGLTLTLSADGTKYVVTVETAFEPADFAAYLIANKPASATGTNEKAGTDGTATITGLDAGYYLVDSSLGALCILNTASDTVTVVEKNSAPTITKEVLEDDNNSTHTAITEDEWKNKNIDNEYAVLDVIDTVHYQLTVNTGTDKYTDTATGVDSDYKIVDTLPQGIAYDSTTGVTVKVGTTTWTLSTAGENETPNNDYTVSYNETTRELTIVLLASGSLANLAENIDIIITYDAKMSTGENGVAIGATGNTNTATLTYKSQTSTSSAQVNTYQLVNDANNDGKPDFQKVDGDGNVLAGVTFVLSRDVKGTDDDGNETTTTQYAVVDENGYLTSWGTKEQASELVTDANGGINVKGLDAGTYILTETKTLEGYNLLTDTITVVIAEDGKVTYKLTSSTGTSTDPSTITVVNETGTELPSTGGIGTTIFYVVGSILVLGAAILLITKKRMSNVQ